MLLFSFPLGALGCSWKVSIQAVRTPSIHEAKCVYTIQVLLWIPVLSWSVSQGHLVPSDEITVHYGCEPAGEYLDKVIQMHMDFILSTIKAPLKSSPVASMANVIVEEKTQVWGWAFLGITSSIISSAKALLIIVDLCCLPMFQLGVP